MAIMQNGGPTEIPLRYKVWIQTIQNVRHYCKTLVIWDTNGMNVRIKYM